MTQYNPLNVKLYYLQLYKLKSRIKNSTKVTLYLSSNATGSSNNETNFPHDLLWANTEILRIRKTFAKSLSANIELSKTQLSKTGQSGFLGKLLEWLQKTCSPLTGNILKPLGKNVLVLLGLTAAVSATDVDAADVAIQKKKNWRIWFIDKYVGEIIRNESKDQKGGFLGMLLGTLGAIGIRKSISRSRNS